VPTDKGPIEQPAAGATSPGRSTTVAGLAIIAVFVAVSVALILQGGAYGPSTWLPLMAAIAALALVVALAGPAIFSGRIQKVLLLVFALQAAWTAASLLWAGSKGNAWEETNRTLLYALTLVLVFAAVRWAGEAALKALAIAVAGLAGAVALWILITFAVSADPLPLFLGGRLNYPITYFNGLAALLMVGFWLALGMANGARCARRTDPDDAAPQDGESLASQSRVAWRRSQAERKDGDRFPRWTQPLLLVLAVVLAETALLPQSRGALWTFFLVVPFFILLSPNRFRALVNLLIAAAPVVLFWHNLNDPYLAITSQTPLDAAIHSCLLGVAYSVAMVVGAWAVTWLVERWIGPLRRRVAVWIGVALAAVVILGAAGGIVLADMRTGGLDGYLQDRWHEMTADSVGDTKGDTRFTGVGLNGRWRQWKVSAEAFRSEPLLGIGAQNFEHYWYEHRPVAFTVRQPHSQPMQLLAELGLPGVILWLVFVIATLVRAASVRFRASTWGKTVILAAMMTAVISWFIHSSADWLWQLAGVTLPAMLLLGGLIGADRSLPTLAGVQTRTSRPIPVPLEPVESADATETAETQHEGSDIQAETVAPSESHSPRDRHTKDLRRSPIARTAAVVVALVALVSAALPYVSSRYSDLAAGSTDLQRAAARADTAAALDPTSIQPFTALAGLHMSAAAAAPNSEERLRQLRLAADVWLRAVEVDPTNWVCQFGVAQALIAARDVALAVDRASAQELEKQARIHLTEARRLNPLSPEIDDLEQSLRRLSAMESY
jgi:hypothetical protein